VADFIFFRITARQTMTCRRRDDELIMSNHERRKHSPVTRYYRVLAALNACRGSSELRLR